jgi:hypothetical protein
MMHGEQNVKLKQDIPLYYLVDCISHRLARRGGCEWEYNIEMKVVSTV